jgi:hypothetical protein
VKTKTYDQHIITEIRCVAGRMAAVKTGIGINSEVSTAIIVA